MYDNCLEITNPGDLQFGVTPEKLAKPHESKPWNPIIANVFYRAGIIERWGAGTLSIIDWCAENSNPAPTWQEQAGSVYGTFLPAALPDIPQVTPEVRRMLAVIQGEMSRMEIQQKLGLTDEKHFREHYQQPAVAMELIEMTIPDKPRGKNQQYRLTAKGRGTLNDECRVMKAEGKWKVE